MNEQIDMFQDVLEFHKKFGCVLNKQPTNIPPAVKKLRKDLINEEFKELKEAMQKNDLVGIADAGADLMYVVLGTMVAYGIDIRPIWNEVQRTNLAKVGGKTREDGKVMKPPNWQAPDLKTILENQTDIVD